MVRQPQFVFTLRPWTLKFFHYTFPLTARDYKLSLFSKRFFLQLAQQLYVVTLMLSTAPGTIPSNAAKALIFLTFARITIFISMAPTVPPTFLTEVNQPFWTSSSLSFFITFHHQR